MEFSLHGVESETHAQVDNVIFKKHKKQTRTIHPRHNYPDRLLGTHIKHQRMI